MTDLTACITQAIARANAGPLFSKLAEEIFHVDGMSSAKVRIFLNELCSSIPSCRYLEIGTWKGSTILAASYHNPGYFVAIDNFSQFGSAREEFISNADRLAHHCRFHFIDSDAWQVKPETVFPTNVFFYDGNHEPQDQYRAFVHFDQAFENPFVAIVDDWNLAEVREATQSAFVHLGYKIQQDWTMLSPYNGDKDGWWNGLYAAVINKPQ